MNGGDDSERERSARAARIHEQIEELVNDGGEPSSPAEAADRAAAEEARATRRKKKKNERELDDEDESADVHKPNQPEESFDGED
jgi:hypothetical protein